jgi:hypothetical protein
MVVVPLSARWVSHHLAQHKGDVKMQQMTKGREPFPESDLTDYHAFSPAARLSRIAIDGKLSNTFEYALTFLLGPVGTHVNATLPYISYFTKVRFSIALSYSPEQRSWPRQGPSRTDQT